MWPSILNLVAVKQPQLLSQPFPTPPLPAASSALLRLGSAFALMYIFLLRSCRLMGVFIISPLPSMLKEESRAAGLLRSSVITPLPRYYEPSRHPLVFDRLPGDAGYTVYLAPSISRWDEEGFSSCLTRPCHRAVATTPPELTTASARLPRSMLPSPSGCGLDLRGFSFSGPLCVHSRYGPVTRSPSRGWLHRWASGP